MFIFRGSGHSFTCVNSNPFFPPPGELWSPVTQVYFHAIYQNAGFSLLSVAYVDVRSSGIKFLVIPTARRETSISTRPYRCLLSWLTISLNETPLQLNTTLNRPLMYRLILNIFQSLCKYIRFPLYTAFSWLNLFFVYLNFSSWLELSTIYYVGQIFRWAKNYNHYNNYY